MNERNAAKADKVMGAKVMGAQDIKGHNSIRCEIVTTYEQLLHAQAVRSICFLEEHGMRASFIFDGNDWQATHVIVYAEDEPVGTVRIRWFRDFAQFERTSFRKQWRNQEVIKSCAQFAFDHVARKGYDRVITHASPLYARLWRVLLGFKPVDDKAPYFIGEREEKYIELVKVLEPCEDQINLDSDTTTLFRVEGAWDTPAAHELER